MRMVLFPRLRARLARSAQPPNLVGTSSATTEVGLPAQAAGAAAAPESRTIKRIFLMLYLQFAFYWGTIGFGMLVNYYYSVPGTLGSDFGSIFTQIFTTPLLVGHVAFALLSTGMSIPIIIAARRIGLKPVVRLHAGAITSRLVGFTAGPLFIYYSTTAAGDPFASNISSFVMAIAFVIAVILSFMGRIFIVREDVRIRFRAAPQALAPEGERIG